MENKIKTNINLIVERGRVWNISELPNNSIALDGAVTGPYIDNEKKIYSFDHHGNCIRHISNATCVQVLDAILLGFDPNEYNVYINDVDEDTVLSLALLLKNEIAYNEKTQDIIRNIGFLDAHGPSYPIKKEMQEQIEIISNFIMSSYYHLKREKQYSQANLKDLILECVEKFYLMLDGKISYTKNIVKPIKYELEPKTNADWIMIHSSDYIFGEFYEKGYNKIVSWDQLLDNSYTYTIGKKSEFIDFPVKEILFELNKIEAGWGGGSTIGGSPRNFDGSRSNLSPDEIVNIINKILTEKKNH